MAGAPAGFADLMNRKYDILQQNASSESALREAQAQGITGALGSENALRNAQAFSATQQGKTLAPLADASIDATRAGIGQTQAQTGLIGAQTGLVGAQTGEIGFNTFAPASDAELLNHRYQMMTNQNFGLNTGNGLPSSSLTPVTGSLGTDNGYKKIKPIGNTTTPGYAAGTASVPEKGTSMNKGQPQVAPPMDAGPMHMTLHDVMAHALGTLHAAGGATTVSPAPAPGQTITSGTWTPPNANPPQGQNQDLRAKMGFGVKAAGGATAISAKGGATKVPGKGAPNVDSVPATLAPQEAVLNQGAADHLGRGTIAALNALGAAKMAANGQAPATPPSPHGMMAPARGAPPKTAAKAPAKGAPPIKAKVAAKGGKK